MAGASAALAGLVLVFLGTLLAAYQGIGGDSTWIRTKGRIKTASLVALGIFGIALSSLVLDVAWLIAAGGGCFYLTAVGLFFVQVAALAAGGAWMTLGVLLKG